MRSKDATKESLSTRATLAIKDVHATLRRTQHVFANLCMWPLWFALKFVSVWIITSRHVDACMTTLCSTNSTIPFQSMIIFHQDERPTGATSGGGKHAPYNSERDAEYDNYYQCRCMGCAQCRVQRLVSMRVHGTCSIHCLHHLGCNDAWTYTDV